LNRWFFSWPPPTAIPAARVIIEHGFTSIIRPISIETKISQRARAMYQFGYGRIFGAPLAQAGIKGAGIIHNRKSTLIVH
jgi:hypothetical protein